MSIKTEDTKLYFPQIIPGYLIVPRVRLARYGQRAFAYAVPCVWNSLPTDLKNYNLSLAVFKRRLKSYFLTRHNL